jgi:hypothetical protein
LKRIYFIWRNEKWRFSRRKSVLRAKIDMSSLIC